MEKLEETWKNWVATKNSLLTSRFGGLSVQFKIIFQKKLRPCFVWHKYCLPIFSSLTMLHIFPIFHLVFIMYILVQYMTKAMYVKTVKIKAFSTQN